MSQYRVIANRDHEVLYNDGKFLDKCSILIFKKEPETIDDFLVASKCISGKTLKRFKGNQIKKMAKAIKKYDMMVEDINSTKREFVYTQDMLNPKVFKLFMKITTDSFAPIPLDLPDGLPHELCVNTPDDMRKLINEGYEIYAFTSIRQYGKILADYFIRNKEMYKINKSNDSIYHEFVYAPRFVRTGVPAEDVYKETIDKLLNAEDYWNKHEKEIESIIKRGNDYVSGICNNRKQQGTVKGVSTKSRKGSGNSRSRNKGSN